MTQRKSLRELFPGKEPKKIGPIGSEIRSILKAYDAAVERANAKGEEHRRTRKDRFSYEIAV